jgi:3-oxoacyl-[acyl-carrier protein] reductase
MEQQMNYLQRGDSVVVTGSAQGIGKAIAVHLAGLGANLDVWDVSAERCADTVDACRRAGATAYARQVDVSNHAQVDAAAKLAIAAHGPVFGLVNNAGIFPRVHILEAAPEIWQSVLAVNLLGSVFCSQALGRQMVQHKRGCIVNMASGRALQGTPRGAHYAASKAGIVSFTKSLALELAQHGIRCNSIIPGVTETAQPLEDTTVEELRSRGAHIPLGRIGRPEDIANVAGFLFSSAASYMTGQAVVVNGGAIMVP